MQQERKATLHPCHCLGARHFGDRLGAWRSSLERFLGCINLGLHNWVLLGFLLNIPNGSTTTPPSGSGQSLSKVKHLRNHSRVLEQIFRSSSGHKHVPPYVPSFPSVCEFLSRRKVPNPQFFTTKALDHSRFNLRTMARAAGCAAPRSVLAAAGGPKLAQRPAKGEPFLPPTNMEPDRGSPSKEQWSSGNPLSGSMFIGGRAQIGLKQWNPSKLPASLESPAHFCLRYMRGRKCSVAFVLRKLPSPCQAWPKKD